ncbi:MAG: glycosyltransferase family 4 protein [Planctomycetota bacterium]|nr:glycosyltransferase family 4 protein [Planctomycetota bacterium]
MKIALIILHADTQRGGAERYTLNLAHTLAGDKHDVTLLASSFGQLPAAVKPVQIGQRALTRTGRYLRFLDALDKHLGQCDYDLMHAMLPVHRCDVYHPHAGVAAEMGGAWFSRPRRFAQVERELLTGTHTPVVLCLSDYIKRDLRKHYTIDQGRLFSLFNAVDLRRFDPAANEDRAQTRAKLRVGDEQVLSLMIAQDFDRKGLRQAIEALAQVPDRRMVLAVVGGDASPPYRRLAKKLGVAERVIFAGVASDPRPFYRAADFFVLPTLHDPCSLAVLESLTMGMPVISTIQNGACEIMRDGQEGFILQDPLDVTRLAEAMQAMLEPDLRARMRQACLALRPRLSHEEHMLRLMEAYRIANAGFSPTGVDQSPAGGA